MGVIVRIPEDYLVLTNLTIFVEEGNNTDFSSSLARCISKYGAENVAYLDDSIWVRVKK